MKRKVAKLLTVLIAFTPGYAEVFASGEGTSYVAKWKNDTEAAFSLTIDDNGPADARSAQASILEEYGIHSTFAIITGSLSPARTQMFLDIFNQGHELASHSVTHPFLNGASIDSIWSELSESKLYIEQLTGAPCVSYAAPYGQLDPSVMAVAHELYISARGTRFGINAVAGANIFDLNIAPLPPYFCDVNTYWTDEEYIQSLHTYVEEVVAIRGWGIEMWHNIASDQNDLNSGAVVSEYVFRSHLAELAFDYQHKIWIAPQGEVARYHLEWQETTIEILAVTEDAILLNLLFDGDKTIFDEPLTVVTVLPMDWLSGELVVIQNGRGLDYKIDVDGDEPCLLYDAIPGGGVISILKSAAALLN